MRVTRQIVRASGQKDPEYFELLAALGKKVMRDSAESNYYHQAIVCDDIEYATIGKISSWVLEGLLLRVRINVGCTPYADKMVRANDAALKHLPKPFNGAFWGGCGGSDGNLEWDDSIRVQRHICSNDGCIDKTEKHHAGLASLEVGYCPASQLIDRLLFRNDGVARWPYDEEWMLLFVWDMDQKMKYLNSIYPSVRSRRLQIPRQLKLWH